MESLVSDLRYGARMLWKNKGVSLVALISLAAGIGANSAIFSLANSILFRPRPVVAPEELVELYSGHRGQPYQTSSYPSYLDFRERNEVFTGLAAYGIDQFRLGYASEVEQVWGESVSGNYFGVLGVPLFLGRGFLAEEDQVPNRNPVMIVGYALWQRRFGSDPALVGRTVTVNNQPMTVVGIAPPQYSGMMRGLASEIWVPAMMKPALDPSGELALSRQSKWVTMVGRLKPGTTIEQARARFDLLSEQMRAAYPDEWRERREEFREPAREYFVSVLSERETRVHPQMRTAAYALVALLLVIVDLVLAIACMNLAGVLLARAVARRKEIGVRLALGAGRTRIIRQLLTESVLLSSIAGVVGIVLSVWTLNLVVAFMPPLPEGLRVAVDVRLDWRVVVYSVVFSTVTGILFGPAPALHGTKSDVATILKDEPGGSTTRQRTSRWRSSLVTAQVAFSLLLLIGAGLVLRSLEKVRPTRLRFDSNNFVVAPLSLDETRYDRSGTQRFYVELAERIRAEPGVQDVSLVEGMPGGFLSRSRTSIEIEGYQPQPDEDMQIDAAVAGPGYFTNMKVPFVLGRDFDDRDREGTPCVAIVNEAFIARYLGGTSNAVGKHLGRNRPRKELCEIVGVIHDNAWQALQTEPRPFYSLALLQSDRKQITMLVHAVGDPSSLVGPVRRAIRALDTGMPVTDVQTLSQQFAVGLYPFRLLGFVVGACGMLALFLATIGIYGMVSYSVAQRQREVGIRLALGAMRGEIVRLVVRQAMLLVGYGLGAGLVLGFALTRALTSLPLDMPLLFGVSATDSLTFAGMTIGLLFVALMACYVPARRAARVDPVVTLRSG
jgi:predicted permease